MRVDDQLTRSHRQKEVLRIFTRRNLSPPTTFRQSIIPTRLLPDHPPSPNAHQIRSFSSLLAGQSVGLRKFCHSSFLAEGNERKSGKPWLRYDSYRPIHLESTYRRMPSQTPDNIPAIRGEDWSQYRARTTPGKMAEISRLNPYLVPNTKRVRGTLGRWTYYDDQLTPKDADGLEASGDSLWASLRVELDAAEESFTEDDVLAARSLRAHTLLAESAGAQPLTHLTCDGEAHMVSIAGKSPTNRSAAAISLLLFTQYETYQSLSQARQKKGDALAVARVAGIQAAKKTSDLIPLAHPSLAITSVKVDLTPFEGPNLPLPVSKSPNLAKETGKYGGILITATVSCEGKTGVEMEALTAVTVAGLTLYDMLKAVDKGMSITQTRVFAKRGGKSGDWHWNFALGVQVKGLEEDLPPEERQLENALDVQSNANDAYRNYTNVEQEKTQRFPVDAEDFRQQRIRRFWGQSHGDRQ
jgi:molybdenum cofactor biosynthesis protein MoaC